MSEKISPNRTVTPNEAKAAIRKCIRKSRPVFLWGGAGIGKSDIVHQIAEEQGREVIDVRLNLWDPTDIKGFPFFNPEKKVMEWAPPAELPTDPDSTALLFLDELSSAAPSTQAAAYQLILNRRVGSYRLPAGVSIVAAGNRDSDKGVTYRMPAPLANRFIHLELRVDYDDYAQWALKNHIHEQVLGYLSFAKQDLHDFDPKGISRSFPTPRAWTFVSELLEDDDVAESTLTDLVSGAVGEGVAVKFMAHRKVAKQMPDPVDVLAGKVTECKIKEISAMYSLVTSLCYELQAADRKKVPNWNDQVDNFLAFMMDNFPTELIILGAKIAVTDFELPFDSFKLKNFDRFHNKYGKYIIQALSDA
jgi:hypothetical protein